MPSSTTKDTAQAESPKTILELGKNVSSIQLLIGTQVDKKNLTAHQREVTAAVFTGLLHAAGESVRETKGDWLKARLASLKLATAKDPLAELNRNVEDTLGFNPNFTDKGILNQYDVKNRGTIVKAIAEELLKRPSLHPDYVTAFKAMDALGFNPKSGRRHERNVDEANAFYKDSHNDPAWKNAVDVVLAPIRAEIQANAAKSEGTSTPPLSASAAQAPQQKQQLQPSAPTLAAQDVQNRPRSASSKIHEDASESKATNYPRVAKYQQQQVQPLSSAAKAPQQYQQPQPSAPTLAYQHVQNRPRNASSTQPPANIVQKPANVVQPTMNVVQPPANVVQPPANVATSKQAAQPTLSPLLVPLAGALHELRQQFQLELDSEPGTGRNGHLNRLHEAAKNYTHYRRKATPQATFLNNAYDKLLSDSNHGVGLAMRHLMTNDKFCGKSPENPYHPLHEFYNEAGLGGYDNHNDVVKAQKDLIASANESKNKDNRRSAVGQSSSPSSAYSISNLPPVKDLPKAANVSGK